VFILLHIKTDGSVTYSAHMTPTIPDDYEAGPGDLLFMVHPTDLRSIPTETESSNDD